MKSAELAKRAAPFLSARTDGSKGLSSEEVASRSKLGLKNTPPKGNARPYWRIFFDNICSYFNVALFVVAIVMVFAGIKTVSSYLFLTTIGANIIIGIIADIRAKRIIEKLKVVGQKDTTVIREGKKKEIFAEEVVLGDIVILSSGDQIVADSEVLSGELRVNESMLTGESVAVTKRAGDLVLAGSYVVSGKATTQVMKVSSLNYSASLETQAKTFKRPKSELKDGCFKIFRITAILATAIGLIMFLVGYLQTKDSAGGFDFKGTMLSVSGSVVAMIPTGLYLLTSITLTKGVIALGLKHINVQELYSIETLARVDMICFDKTGTLTDGNLEVVDLIPFDSNEEEIKTALASIISATGDNNVTAKALRSYGGERAKVASANLPFSSENKYSAATIDGLTWVMGAPNFIKVKESEKASKLIENAAKAGRRVLILCVTKNEIENQKVTAECDLKAIIILEDHIKEDAKETIAWFKENDVVSKVISGDDPLTVSSIAIRCGVPNADHYIDLSKVSDEELESLALTATIFGRSTPEQKAKLIQIFQKNGHSVAMTGDGVNDILALKQADCSIAMGSGSTAAQHCAHLISMDDDFAKLPDVVYEGRRVINNLQRTSSLFLTKTIFAVLTSIAFFILSLTIGQPYPYETSNLFIWEIAVIGGGGFFLAFEPSKERLKGSFIQNIFDIATPGGVLAAIMTVIFFVIHNRAPSFLPFPQFMVVSVIAFTILAFTSLFRVSYPFSKFRLLIFLAMVFAGAGLFAVDIFWPTNSGRSLIEGLNYSGTNPAQIGLMFGMVAAFTFIYFFITSLIFNREKRKKENKNENPS